MRAKRKGFALATHVTGRHRIGGLILLAGSCFAAIFTWGCVKQEASFPEAPPVHTVIGGKQVGLAAVRDVRGTTEVGSVGLASFRAGPELDDHLREMMESRLSERNFWVVMVADSSNAKAGSSSKFQGKVIQVTLVSATANTPDAILVPADCEVVLAIVVDDASGKVVYQQHYSSSKQSRLASFNPASSVGQAIAETADSALDRAFGDPQFMAAID
jgi:hypothetical protein